MHHQSAVRAPLRHIGAVRECGRAGDTGCADPHLVRLHADAMRQHAYICTDIRSVLYGRIHGRFLLSRRFDVPSCCHCHELICIYMAIAHPIKVLYNLLRNQMLAAFLSMQKSIAVVVGSMIASFLYLLVSDCGRRLLARHRVDTGRTRAAAFSTSTASPYAPAARCRSAPSTRAPTRRCDAPTRVTP